MTETMRLKDCPIIRKEICEGGEYKAIADGMIIGTDEEKSFVAIFDQEEKLIFSTKDIADGKVIKAYVDFSYQLRRFSPEETHGYLICVAIEGGCVFYNDKDFSFLYGIYTFQGKELIPPGRYVVPCNYDSYFLKWGISVTSHKEKCEALYSYEGECLISEKMGYQGFIFTMPDYDPGETRFLAEQKRWFSDRIPSVQRDKFGFYLAVLGIAKNTGKYLFDPYSYDFKRILPEGCYLCYKFLNGNMVFANIDENRVAQYGLMDAMGNIKRYADCIDYTFFETNGGKEIVILYKDNNSMEIYSEDFQLLDELPCYGRVKLMPAKGGEYTYWGEYQPDGVHYELLHFSEGKANRVFPVEEYKATKIYLNELCESELYFVVCHQENCCSFYKLLEKEIVPMKIKVEAGEGHVLITDQDRD